MSRSELRLSLSLLGCLIPGVVSAEQADESSMIPELQEGLEQGDALSEDATWVALLPLWQEAAAVGSGERGAYPFDREGKDKLLARLEASKATLDALEGRGLLSPPEAGLLKADVDTIISAVGKKRPREMEMATCYRPMMVNPTQDCARRLELRLPLLEQLAAESVLHPTVVERVLVQVEADIAGVLAPLQGYPMDPEAKSKARTTAKGAEAQVAAIRARIEDSP